YQHLVNLKIPYKIIPHGIDNHFYIKSNEMLAKLNSLDDRKLKLLSVCRLLPYKNIEFVINKLNEIKDKIDFEYNIYGDGSQFEKLKLQIEKLGLSKKIFLHGRV